jgi:hypothetical protein
LQQAQLLVQRHATWVAVGHVAATAVAVIRKLTPVDLDMLLIVSPSNQLVLYLDQALLGEVACMTENGMDCMVLEASYCQH